MSIDKDSDELKRCSRCKEHKPRNEFYKNSTTKDGFGYYCKPCEAARVGIKSIDRNLKHAVLREQGKKRCRRCEAVKDFGEFYKNPQQLDGRELYCKECLRGDKRRKDNAKEYYQKNKKTLQQKHNAYRMKRYYSDPAYRLGMIVSKRIRRSLKDRRGSKNDKYFSALGYTPEDLVRHIESQWEEGWNWDNYGEVWVVDHIYPHSKLPYDSLTHPNYKKAWALSNLRPLCIKENMSKGSKVLGEYDDITLDVE